MIAPAQREANPREARKSTGPSSGDGHERSRSRAVKRGPAAPRDALRAEDPQALHDRLRQQLHALQPRDDIERFLMEQATWFCGEFDRVKRAKAARLADRAAEAARREQDEAIALGRRLFWHNGGPISLYPFVTFHHSGSPASSSRIADDPVELVKRLEATAAGCEWLRDRWAELRGRLVPRVSWLPSDTLRAIRLLGRQMHDAGDVPEVALILWAAHALDPETNAIALFRGELDLHQLRRAKEWLKRQPIQSFVGDKPKARQALLDIVERASDRLAALARRHERAAALGAHRAAGEPPSEEGDDRLHRYENDVNRTLGRTLKTIRTMRRASEA
jgi:hypothetical protein